MPRDLVSDEEWSLFEHFILAICAPNGRKPTNHRLVLDGIFWIARTGSPWRDLATQGRTSSRFNSVLAYEYQDRGLRETHRLTVDSGPRAGGDGLCFVRAFAQCGGRTGRGRCPHRSCRPGGERVWRDPGGPRSNRYCRRGCVRTPARLALDSMTRPSLRSKQRPSAGWQTTNWPTIATAKRCARPGSPMSPITL